MEPGFSMVKCADISEDILNDFAAFSAVLAYPVGMMGIRAHRDDLTAQFFKPAQILHPRQIVAAAIQAAGIGMEFNTSGLDRCGEYLPGPEYLRRFKELGGEIVTVGSDAHHANRVGQYCREAAGIVQDIFGYVCTFADRKPQFHTL